jgi:hypothetical protein
MCILVIMTRHVTDPEEALARAMATCQDLAKLKQASGLRSAYEDVASGAKLVATSASSAAGVTNTAASLAVNGGALATVGFKGVSVIGQTLGAFGAVAAATPVGIALAGVNALYHLKAVYSTEWHIRALKAMHEHANQSPRRWRQWQTSQKTISVLGYALTQKAEKSLRRGVSAVPGIGVMSTIYTLGRYVYKTAKGTKGKDRLRNAQDLVAGIKGTFVRGTWTPDYLAVAMMIELIGPDDFTYAITGPAYHDWDGLVPIVQQKLAST